MSLVIQQPNSQTNPTEKYRVCDYEGWVAYINGATLSYAFVEYETYAEAWESTRRVDQ